ncbi:MAG: hypothetical protein EBW39_01900 [Betaproteobacteria bacterium]|nr:hypothetical protein [Betaproteobacteria bacterium]
MAWLMRPHGLAIRHVRWAWSVLFSFLSFPAFAQISIVNSGAGSNAVNVTGAYVQSFNSLTNAGTNTWTDNSTLPGWYAAYGVTDPTNSYASLVAVAPMYRTNFTNTILYSVPQHFDNNTTNSSYRALGFNPSGGTNGHAGLRLVNNTGSTITGFTLTYEIRWGYSQDDGVDSFDVIAGGSGYTSAPMLAVTASPLGGTNNAGGTAVTNTNGNITDITKTNGGGGYTSVPSVAFTGGGGSNALARAIMKLVTSSNSVTLNVKTFAGGSGITPILSILQTRLMSEPSCRFSLVYGNRHRQSIMFFEALEDLKNQYMDRFQLIHVLSEEEGDLELHNGLLDQAKCAQLLKTLIAPAGVSVAYLCGPEPMMLAAQAALIETRVDRSKILMERFGSAVSGAGSVPAPMPKTDHFQAPADHCSVTINIDGKARKLAVPRQGPSILQMGLSVGMPLPFACQAAVCCTCRAKVMAGKVQMDKNYTLRDDEIAQGFVLTCQAHPLSDQVVLSFDER